MNIPNEPKGLTMPNYIFAYHGGMMPEDKDEMAKIMAAWGAWMQEIGSAFADKGSPLGQSHTISASGVKSDGGANPITGYSIITASDLDAAIDMAKGCPGLGNGGSVEVAECMSM